MIIRMAKVEVIGPRELLMEVLTVIRELGIMEIEAEGGGFVGSPGAPRLTEARESDRDAAERLVLAELRARITDLLACLPPLQLRESYLEPATVIDTIAAGVERHGKLCRELRQQRETLRRERGELERYTDFLATVGTLVGRVETKSGLDFIGITLR
ncbi:MAG TPA: ATPase, partial [Geobacteraceae bacterium]